MESLLQSVSYDFAGYDFKLLSMNKFNISLANIFIEMNLIGNSRHFQVSYFEKSPLKLLIGSIN